HLCSATILRRFADEGICFSTVIQKCLQQWVLVLPPSHRSRNDGWDWRLQRNKHGFRVRQLADFTRCERHAFAGSNNGQKRSEVLNVVPKVRSESSGLACGTNGG